MSSSEKDPSTVAGKATYEAYLAKTGRTSDVLLSWQRGNLSDSMRAQGFGPDDTEDALVYWAALPRAPSIVPQNATAAQNVTRQEYRKTLRKKFPAPSSYSKAAEGWGTFQNTVAIACHKPFGFDGTPVVLLNSVLGELYTNLNGDYEPSRDDCRFAQKLMEVMAHPFTKEEDLRDQFVLWMQDSLGWQLQRSTMDGSISDATLEVSVNHLSDARVMIMNKEDKLAKGEGRGDAYMQNIGYYTKYWASAHEQIFTRCVCPSILLEQAGHEISISGCVFAEKIICDPFLVVNILPVLHDATHRIRVARMVGSLRCAITGLINFYNKIPVTSVFDPFPQFREFKFRGEDMKITYVEQIKGLVYKATAANSNENTKDIIVKFCHSYSEEAHRICAEEGAAPELLFIDKCSYFQVVVMDFITNSKTLYDLDDSIAAEVKDKVQVVVNKLHQHNIVHGDLRANNILVKTEGNNQKIYLIDFDWAGIANQSTYPFFMNHEDIKWPHGAEDGKKLQKSHDQTWINWLFKSPTF